MQDWKDAQTRHAEVSVAKAQIAWAVWSWRFIEKRQPVPSQFRKLNQLWYLTHEMTYTAGFYNGYSPKNPNGPVDAGKRTYYLWLSSKAYQALLKAEKAPGFQAMVTKYLPAGCWLSHPE